MRTHLGKWLKFSLRWGIAIAGIAWVVSNLSLRDTVLMLNPRTNLPERAAVVENNRTEFKVVDPENRAIDVLQRRDLVTRPDRKSVILADGTKVKLLGTEPGGKSLLVEDPQTHHGKWIDPEDVKGGFRIDVPYPLVEPGLQRMLHDAAPIWLWLAVLIFPITFVITAFRWHELLKALDINMGVGRAFVLNMVGAFYNTFMPGSTGGDVLKAIYAAKQAPDKRTRAVMSVIVDRAIGLLALIILGGFMATLQWRVVECRRVAYGVAVMLFLTIVTLLIFYMPVTRRLLKKLPMQEKLNKIIEVMDIYRRRPMLVLAALVSTFPVHMTVIISAALAGHAFNLNINFWYYWVIVPVIVLAGSVPISPQGAGVMEFFAVKLTETRGGTVSEALALTMSIRLVQILWNLTGGIFVLRGGFHAPTQQERNELETPLPIPVQGAEASSV